MFRAGLHLLKAVLRFIPGMLQIHLCWAVKFLYKSVKQWDYFLKSPPYLLCVTVRSPEYIIWWWAALWYVKFIKSDVSVSASEGTTCCQLCLVVGAFSRGRNTTRLNGVCPGEMRAPDLDGKGMRNFQNRSAQSLAACESSWRNLTLWFFISKGETTNERVSKAAMGEGIYRRYSWKQKI